MRTLITFVAAVSVAAFVPGWVAAQTAAVEFSARLVQKTPDKKTTQGKIYMGLQQMRSEMGTGDQQRIMITDRGRQVAWLLNPARKEYVEMRGPAPGGGQRAPATRPPLPGDPGSPCGRQKEVSCNKLSAESINGRNTEKWEIVMSRGEQSMRSVVWVDRRLGMPVREELPGGFVRELLDVREGPQHAGLFRLPEGYRKIEMPKKDPRGAQPRR